VKSERVLRLLTISGGAAELCLIPMKNEKEESKCARIVGWATISVIRVKQNYDPGNHPVFPNALGGGGKKNTTFTGARAKAARSAGIDRVLSFPMFMGGALSDSWREEKEPLITEAAWSRGKKKDKNQPRRCHMETGKGSCSGNPGPAREKGKTTPRIRTIAPLRRGGGGTKRTL